MGPSRRPGVAGEVDDRGHQRRDVGPLEGARDERVVLGDRCVGGPDHPGLVTDRRRRGEPCGHCGPPRPARRAIPQRSAAQGRSPSGRRAVRRARPPVAAGSRRVRRPRARWGRRRCTLGAETRREPPQLRFTVPATRIPMSGTRLRPLAFAAMALCCAAASPARAGFTTFESGQVRSAGAVAGRHPALRRQHARTTGSRSSTSAPAGSTHAGSVPVGLEPVAVAARVDRRGLGGEPPLRQRSASSTSRPTRRASCARCWSATSRATSSSRAPARDRAFITTAHRGQQRTHPSLAAVPGAGDPQLTTAGRRPCRRLGLRRRRAWARRWAACRCAS